ncbi:RluA family pseudouridine synthase [Helicobacter felis]|uniref:RluA family pseudouridine synthase n=1 Tax=Helicobacter felis TaxID=214 RepID=UPI000CF14718|nr:RluA family pseudouridine synthase [Helicobacter felis]
MKEWVIWQSGRLDQLLAQELNISRSQVLGCIKAGLVSMDGKICQKGGVEVKPGSYVCVQEPPAVEITPLPTTLNIECLYEDEDLLVINKPPHLAVHPAPSLKEESLVDYLVAKGYQLSNLNGASRCGIVHRLDKDTSGALVIAKNNACHAHLSTQLQSRQMGRYYVALIQGHLREPLFVECHLGRHPKNRLKRANLDLLKVKGGKPSKTFFVPLFDGLKCQLVGARLYSGRTHQVRAHLESLGRPILGDRLYGAKEGSAERTMLHAYILYLIHPRTGHQHLFKAELLKDMVECAQSHLQGNNWYGCLQEASFLERFSTLFV